MTWRFALRPKWIVRHVAVAALVITMVLLGFWQLRRLDEKQAHRALVEARRELPAAAVTDVVPADASVDDEAVDAVLYRTVTAVGRYVDDDTVVVENRTFNGASGGWVLTPLRLEDDTAVVVNRGFIGFDRTGDIVAPSAPTASVTVKGLVLASQRRGGFGPQDPRDGQLERLARVDLDRLEAQVDYEVLPAYVQVVESRPPEAPPTDGAPALVPLDPPDPDEGPHLAYAVQWFTFTTIATVGYGLLLRRVARDEGVEPSRVTLVAPSGR